MNKKQGDQMQFSLERKKTRKKKMDSSNPSYKTMDCVIKLRDRFSNSFKNFFHLPENVYHAIEKTAEMS